MTDKVIYAPTPKLYLVDMTDKVIYAASADDNSANLLDHAVSVRTSVVDLKFRKSLCQLLINDLSNRRTNYGSNKNKFSLTMGTTRYAE